MDLCVRSVRDQTHCDGAEKISLEHIIQDAGTPGIEAFARDWGAAFYDHGVQIFPAASTVPSAWQLTVHRENDAGMYDAVNRGLEKASGSICSYLNCDEQYLPGALEHVRGFLVKHPETEILFGDAVVADEQGKPLAYRRAVRPGPEIAAGCPLNVLTCATFFRRQVPEKHGDFPSSWKIIGDLVWTQKLSAGGIQSACLPEAVAVFMLAPTNLSAGRRANEESREWRKQLPKVPPAEALFWRCYQVAKKTLAGCYLPRSVSISIYRPGHELRQTLVAKDLGHFWPRQDVSSAALP